MEETARSACHPVCASDTTTEGFRVTVRSVLIPERSHPNNHEYFYAYHICITNRGPHTATLEWRRWCITDAVGHETNITGPGVVGRQPRLAPGESFEYTSFCPLTTSFGTMEGAYRMVSEDGRVFEVAVGPFGLLYPPRLN